MREVKAVCINHERGRKFAVQEAFVTPFGLKDDFHAQENSSRQISFLFEDSIRRIIDHGLTVNDGAFGENLVISGSYYTFEIGEQIAIGDEVLLEVTIIGKTCHAPCAIYQTIGTCIMPEEGVFCKVIKGGKIKHGDRFSNRK